MKTLLKIGQLVVTTLIFTSCYTDFAQNKIIGNKKMTEQTRTISESFTKVKASTGVDVYIAKGESKKIIVEAEENIIDYIKTEVENGTLKVYCDKNIWRSKARKIYVSTPKLTSVKASSGSDVETEDVFNSKNFEVTTSSGADAKIRINSQNIIASSSSGSDLEIIGTAENGDFSSSSGSDLDASKLITKHVIASSSSGSDMEVYAQKSINAKASSGSDIDYEGNPENVVKKESSGGDISKK